MCLDAISIRLIIIYGLGCTILVDFCLLAFQRLAARHSIFEFDNRRFATAKSLPPACIALETKYVIK